MPERPALRFLYAVTVPITAAAFLRDHLAHLARRGHDVHLVSSPDPRELLLDVARGAKATPHEAPLRRPISPRADLAALWSLYRTMRRVRPQVTNVGTPKAGLVGGIAAVLARVPARVYTLHGLRSETARSSGRLARLRPLLLLTERIACAAAHRVVCVSASNRDEAVALGVLNPRKAVVLGAGSASGIDVERWAHPEPAQVAAARASLGLAPNTPVVGYLGRLVPQKGVPELLEAWRDVHRALPEARLLLVGDEEDVNPLPAEARETLRTAGGVVRLAHVDDPAPLYPLLRALALPSRHEGLGMVLLEAAAAGVATLTTDAPGVRDAAVPDVTGLRVPPGDPAALAEAMKRLLGDPALAAQLGRAGRAWVQEEFSRERLNGLWDDFYADLWAERRFARTDRLKRAVDVVGAATALALLGGPMLLTALAVRVFLGSPVVFRQKRPGRDGRLFTMYKFRTMTDARGPDGALLPDDVRLTRFGRFLRATSLDELPELVNVLRGDMSLVGPRPLMPEYLPLYSPEQARRHEVRPGMTGLAQVSGRNALSWEEKFRLDVEYVDSRSLALDLRLMGRTVRAVLAPDGVSAQGHVTMPPFRGTAAPSADPSSTPPSEALHA